MRELFVALVLCGVSTSSLAWNEVYGPAPPGDTCPSCPRSWVLHDTDDAHRVIGWWQCKRIDNKPVCGPYHQTAEGAKTRLDSLERDSDRADREFEKIERMQRDQEVETKQQELENRVRELENKR
jgi:hypothetical protein